MRCFCLGTNTLQDGTHLGTSRMLDMHHPIAAEVFQVTVEGVEEDSFKSTSSISGRLPDVTRDCFTYVAYILVNHIRHKAPHILRLHAKLSD
jgi:hypothetical protein